MTLPKVDLNLFQVFDAVYQERNLTRAGRILHITQPAVSNALRRLREVFGDALFVRTPRGVAPTPVADTIAPRVREALNLLGTSVSEGEVFQPATSGKSFAVGMHDLDEAILAPRLMQRLGREAPGVSVECVEVARPDLESELAAGSLDLALDVPLFSVPQLCRQQVSTERYVCALRRDHPRASEPLTLERYLALEHIHVSSRRRGVGHVDMALEQLGLERRIRLRMRSYVAAPQVVATTDLALTIPRALAVRHELALLELPFSVDRLDQFLYWHRSADRDRANTWLRTVLLDLLSESDLAAAAQGS